MIPSSGDSSVGRASDWRSEGRVFDPRSPQSYILQLIHFYFCGPWLLSMLSSAVIFLGQAHSAFNVPNINQWEPCYQLSVSIIGAHILEWWVQNTHPFHPRPYFWVHLGSHSHNPFWAIFCADNDARRKEKGWTKINRTSKIIIILIMGKWKMELNLVTYKTFICAVKYSSTWGGKANTIHEGCIVFVGIRFWH